MTPKCVLDTEGVIMREVLSPGNELSVTGEGKMNQDSHPPLLQIRLQPKCCQG